MKLLFIPGSACGPKTWLLQTRHFKGSEAIALPGHPEGEPCDSVEGYTEWLREYIVQRQYSDIVLVGHSMGGAVAQLYALKYGADLKGLVLISTGARLRISPDLLKVTEGMITDEPAWKNYLEERHRTTMTEARQDIIGERFKIGPAVMLNDFLACDRFDVMAEVQKIKLPTLVIVGTGDELTPVKYANYLKDKIEGAWELIVARAGHWVLAEKPIAVNRAIEDFITGLSN